ncbi:glycosyltransferase family 2 protein [Belnapia sp. T6]|uniref:Glycosyltransferase family 2 protein n=1 Tax=Belnapia mucosa TaxID=2804532 RepID=A0ABS1V1D2_9PROT|nr:glycosyltransferase family 2 protein [Belnapia mucosa]MBL6455507.1 glycosyltransferase family 2 protein [Belnapia mucosa]
MPASLSVAAWRRAWRWLWDRLPGSALPLRLRLGAAVRRALRVLPASNRGMAGSPEDPATYRAWIVRHDPPLTAADRAAIAAHIAALPARPLISVVMVAQGAPDAGLRAAIASLRGQLYPHWELCIAGDAAAARVVAEEAAADSRIRPAGQAALALARGEFLALVEPDAMLAEQALYAVAVELAAHPEAALIYADEDRLDAAGRRCDPWFKPDFDPDLLRQQDYVAHLGIVRRELALDCGGQDHDLARRVATACGPARIRHIPQILCHRRQAAGTAPQRLTLPEPAPLVSVIIPTRDGAAMLAACLSGLLERTDYPALEILILDNGSETPETFALFERLRQDARVRILPAPGPFNYSALNNQAAAEARGEVLLLLNNDIEVIGPGWLREMVSLLLRPGVGAVGAKLLYADGTLQHGGVVFGPGGTIGHYLPGAAPGATGHHGSLVLVREVVAVTGACLALRRADYLALGGLDAAALRVAFNDIDLCLRLREAGQRILWTPHAELYHRESASRGDDLSGDKLRRFATEIAHMQQRWGDRLRRDPFANPNLEFDRPVPVLAARPPRHRPWKAGG